MEKPIATIPKNSLEEIRVSLTKFKGYDLVDARTYFKDDDGIWRPTKRGLAVRVDYLPDLLKALGKATKQARATGILKE